MKIISGGRNTGKTKTLLEYAQENDAIVITNNARALRVKAQSYGYNVKIIEPADENISTLFGQKVAIHNINDFIQNFYNNYGAEVVAATMTEETNNE